MEITVKGVEPTPMDDPLIVNFNGYDYVIGRKSFNYHILVWPYQRDEKTAGGIITSTGERDSDPYTQRFGVALYVGSNSFPSNMYDEPQCYALDWILYKRYENQIYGHDPKYEIRYLNAIKTDQNAPELTFGVLRADHVLMSFGPGMNPQMIDSTKHIGR